MGRPEDRHGTRKKKFTSMVSALTLGVHLHYSIGFTESPKRVMLFYVCREGN